MRPNVDDGRLLLNLINSAETLYSTPNAVASCCARWTEPRGACFSRTERGPVCGGTGRAGASDRAMCNLTEGDGAYSLHGSYELGSWEDF